MSLENLTTVINEKYSQIRGQQAVAALEKNGFPACYVATKAEALAKVLEQVPSQATVGVGGTVTARELNLLDELTQKGNEVIHHWRTDLSAEEINQLRKEAMLADIYLTSSNAITLQGQLVNIDGIGNRVAAMIFGPGKVIVVAGVNKIVEDVEGGLARIRHVASPKNGLRFGGKTPCSQVGYCTDCESPARMCKATVILEKKPTATDYMVIIIGEQLGY